MNFPAWGRFFLLVLLMSGLSGRARANEQNTRETWSVVVLQEKKCGFDHTTVVRREADHGSEFTTSEHQEFRFKRMGHELRIVCGSAITEDEQGVVLKFSSFTQGAGTNNKLVGYREGEEMVLRNNGKKSPYAMPRSALGPAAVDRLTRALPRKRGATVETDVFMPESPQAPAHISIRSAGRKLVEIEEQTMELWKVVTQNSTLPGVDTIDYIDERGDSHLSLIPFPGIGELRLLRTTPEAAKAKLEAAELFLPSLIFPDKPLPQPRDLIEAEFRLHFLANQLPSPLWKGPDQTVSEADDHSFIVKIKKPDASAPAGWQLPHASDKDLAPFLSATSYLEQTPLIHQLSEKAVGGEKNPILAASRIESFVHAYINRKDLSVGFASADETARSREGDCTEHTVLAAALGRAAGLPTRVVIGIVYQPPGQMPGDKPNGSFGFHMWAEAWIGPDRWLPMDAAFDGFDVGHIAIAKTALEGADPITELTLPVLHLLGALKIEVLSSTANGQKQTP